ncbi:MAG: putative DNA binding domain-containing protein [Prevotella sp.]|nr:putative DNA binding domain-containing protein [Prevotella sp.]
MDAKTIKQMCRLGENSFVQYKQQVDNPSKIAAEIVAFANSKGGTILIGVEDKTGEITGLTYSQVQQAGQCVTSAANNMIHPMVYLQTDTVDVDGKAVLVVSVSEGADKPYKDNGGNIWVKQGSDKRRITDNVEILQLFQQSGSYHPDENGVKQTSLSDINMRLVDDYLSKYYGKDVNGFDLPIDQLLQNLQILAGDGRATLAGLLFFGKHPQMFAPTAMIKAVSFFGNDMGGLNYRDSKDIIGTIPSMFDQGMSFLNANLHSIQAGQSFNSVGKLEISEVALKELLQNALVHRDYLYPAPIRILIFDDRVEIISPGGLPAGVDVNSIRFGKTKQRNPLMASFCAKTMDYRGLGTGIMRVTKEVDDVRFVNDDGNQFQVILGRPDPDAPFGSSGTYVSDAITLPPGYGGNAALRASIDIRKYCPGVAKGDDDNARLILSLCKTTPMGISDMMRHTGYQSRTTFRRRLFTPLLDSGLLVPEFPGSINSPRQRYRSVFPV